MRTLRNTSPSGHLKLAAVALALALLPGVAAAERTDVVVLKNGDRITGEVKKLESGRLEFKTDKAGTIQIDWDIVAALTSEHFFEVVTDEGLRFFGAFTTPDVATTLAVGFLDSTTNLPLEKVARIERIRSSFWARIKGSVDLGFSFTKADTKTEWNTKATANYRTKKRRLKLTAESLFRSQDTAPDVDRQDYSFNSQRFFSGRWLWTLFVASQRNTELALDLRLITGAGVGYHVIQTVEQDLTVIAGLALSEENFSDEREGATSGEGLVIVTYDLYSLGGKDFTTTASLGVFPSLSEGKRVRMESDLDFRKELFNDFYLSLRFYNSFDSAAEEGARNDYGVTTSLGYSW